MSKFTPGPWIWENEPGCKAISAPSTGICVTDGVYDEDQDEANARLISAAPDMYEALQIAFAGTHELGNFPNERAHEYFRTILAKADGKECACRARKSY